MTVAENKAIVTRFNKEFLEKGHCEVLKEIVADDFVNHTAAGSLPNDVEGLKQFAKMLHAGFSDLRVVIHEQVGEDDIIATRKTIQATHTGEILGHLPTGKQVVFNVMDFVRLRDSKYIEHWGHNNLMQVLQQL